MLRMYDAAYKAKVKGHLVQKLEWKQIDGPTDVIVLPDHILLLWPLIVVRVYVQVAKYCGIVCDRLTEVEHSESQPAATELYVTELHG